VAGGGMKTRTTGVNANTPEHCATRQRLWRGRRIRPHQRRWSLASGIYWECHPDLRQEGHQWRSFMEAKWAMAPQLRKKTLIFYRYWAELFPKISLKLIF
jgi:hypothetical protein